MLHKTARKVIKMIQSFKRNLFILSFALICPAIMAAAQPVSPSSDYNYWNDEDKGFSEGTHFMLGYSTNIPNEYLGFDFGFTRTNGIGAYFDFKMSPQSLDISSTLYDDITVEKADTLYHDPLIDTLSSWISYNAGITKPLGKNTCLYGGLGLSIFHSYQQRLDPVGWLGANGYYWIEDTAKKEYKVNVSAGFYRRFAKYLYIKIGGDLVPLGFAAGLGLAL
jgi:hypothetical protein